MARGVCSYAQKHVIDALEGFSQFLARNWEKPSRASIACFLDITTNTCGMAYSVKKQDAIPALSTTWIDL